MRRQASVIGASACLVLALGCGGSSTAPRPATSVGIQVADANASPGDTAVFLITFGHTDTPGDLLELELNFNGQPAGIDSTQIPSGDSSLVVGLVLPTNLPDGALTVSAVLPTEHDSASAKLTIRAAFRPVITTADLSAYGAGPHPFSGQRGQVSLVAGTQEQLHIRATDSVALTYVGWTLGPPANLGDSTVTSEPVYEWDPVIRIPTNLGGTTPELIEFARNSVGQRVELPWGPVAIGQYLDRPVVTAPVDTSVHQLAYDAKRGVLYLATGDQSSVSVVSVTGLATQPAIPLSGPPQSLDLTPGGDTLVVAIHGTANLALVNLVTPGYPTSVVTLTDLALNGTIANVRVASNNRAIAVGTNAQIAHYDLVTGANSIDASTSGASQQMARSGDANRIFFPDQALLSQSAAGTNATLYDAPTNTYAPTGGFVDYGGSAPTADQHGQLYMVQQFVFGPSLATLGWLAYDPDGSRASAISSDGTNAYLALCFGPACRPGPSYYARLALPGVADTIQNAAIGQLLEVVNTPVDVQTLLPLPDGKTLIAMGAGTLMAFDLTQSSPASFARATHAPPRVAPRTIAAPRLLPGRLIPRLFVHMHVGHALNSR